MKYIYILILTFCTLLPSPRLAAQTNPGEVNISLLPGEIYYDTLYSFVPLTIDPTVGVNATSTSIGNKLYAIEIYTDSFTLLKGRVIIEYLQTISQVKYTVFNINFVSSKISARPDFITVSGNDPVTIYPLLNDESTEKHTLPLEAGHYFMVYNLKNPSS